jgi:hypothetical protein
VKEGTRWKVLYSSERHGGARSSTPLGWGGGGAEKATGSDPGLWSRRGRGAGDLRVARQRRADSVGLMEGLNWLLGGLFPIGGVVAALLVAWHAWSRPTTPTARELSLRFESVRSRSGAQFEDFTADLFRAMGHRAVVLGGAGDQGVDVIVNRRGERVAARCKNHEKPVGNRPVPEVFAGARHTIGA